MLKSQNGPPWIQSVPNCWELGDTPDTFRDGRLSFRKIVEKKSRVGHLGHWGYLCICVFVYLCICVFVYLSAIWEAGGEEFNFIPSDKNVVKPSPIPLSTNDYTCTICMDIETPEILMVLECCAQRFHNKCIFKWSKIADSCPMCRQCFSVMFSF